ncbi:MAG: hypothetical protein IPP68_07220 [Elusimicrobia bacterium]|nr:hypothetical protein [Elusimicrobiota bacterium]
MRARGILVFLFSLPALLGAVEPSVPAVDSTTADATLWEKRPIRFPPLFWWEREGDRRFLMASLIYWDWKDTDASQKLLFPLFYSGRETDRSLLVSLPFVAAYRRGAERWLAAGPWYRSRGAVFARTALFPVYWQQTRLGGGRATTFLPFLFYDYRNADRSKIDQVWPVGFRRVRGTETRGWILNYVWARAPDEGFRTLFPLYWHTHSPERRTDVAGPFYRRWESRPDGDRRYAGLFPLAGAGGTLASTAVSSHYLFPVYFYDREPNHSLWLTILASREKIADRRRGHLLLYYYDRDPDQSGAGVFPVFYHGTSADGFSRATQVLNFYDRREGDDRFQTVFPLYGRWRNSGGSRFLSWGIWRRRTELLTAEGISRGTSTSGWAFLYHWKNDSLGNETRVLFPLYWHYKRPPDWGMDLAFPLYFHYRDGPLSLTASPFFVHARREGKESWSWLFLYWRNDFGPRKADLLFPFYYRERGPRRWTVVTPVFWSRRSASSREGALPLAYWYASREKARTFVVPFYGHARTPESRWTVVGLGYHHQNAEGRTYGLFPIWGRFFSEKSSGSYLLPFYWSSGDGKGNGSLVLPLLLTSVAQSKTGTPDRERHVNYLILGSVHHKGPDLSHGFFPLYQFTREGGFRNFWAPRILPLIAWERRGESRLGYLFPYGWRRTAALDWDFVFPLWYRSAHYAVEEGTVPRRGALTERSSAFFPVYWSGANATRSYAFVPPIYGRFDETVSTGTADRHRRFRVVTPLGWSADTAAGGKFRLFFPFYWRVVTAPRADQSTKDVAVYGPWFRVKTAGAAGGSRTVGLAPLFSATRTTDGDRYFDVLGGLYARDARGGRVRHRFLYIFSTAPRWNTGGKK